MKATTAFLCGLAATLLLALGLAQFAERFDPIMNTASDASPEVMTAAGCSACLPSMACVNPDSTSNLG